MPEPEMFSGPDCLIFFFDGFFLEYNVENYERPETLNFYHNNFTAKCHQRVIF